MEDNLEALLNPNLGALFNPIKGPMAQPGGGEGSSFEENSPPPINLYAKFKALLCENWLVEKEADAVLRQYTKAHQAALMQNLWNSNTSDFPAEQLNSLWVDLKKEAVKWINANSPKNPARPMFTNEHELLTIQGLVHREKMSGPV